MGPFLSLGRPWLLLQEAKEESEESQRNPTPTFFTASSEDCLDHGNFLVGRSTFLLPRDSTAWLDHPLLKTPTNSRMMNVGAGFFWDSSVGAGFFWDSSDGAGGAAWPVKPFGGMDWNEVSFAPPAAIFWRS
jgi:hypothetical protein